MKQPKEVARQPHVVVVGSINMDLVTQVPQLPRPGQTVTGRDLQELPGGKGANQAVAAARLGATCSMIGCVGDDGFGDRLLHNLQANGIGADRVRRVTGCSSGVALIGVEESGENAITIVAGANDQVSPQDVAAGEHLIKNADVLLVQLEIPLATVEAAIDMASRHRVVTVLDPAPATGNLPAALFHADVLCPNALEAEAITGISVAGIDGAYQAASRLRECGVRYAIITLGDRGAILCAVDGRIAHVPQFQVEAVDTTAAGDAFAAGIAIGLAEERSILDAVRFGCAAGALAATRFGAQQAMPKRSEVAEIIRKKADEVPFLMRGESP